MRTAARTRKPTTTADRWRVNDPAQYARYITALETIHRDLLDDARAWLGVDALINARGQLVVRRDDREISEALAVDAIGSPTALRVQIVALAGRLAERSR